MKYQAKSPGKSEILGAKPSVERQPELRLCDVVESVPGIAGFKVRVEDPGAQGGSMAFMDLKDKLCLDYFG